MEKLVAGEGWEVEMRSSELRCTWCRGLALQLGRLYELESHQNQVSV